MTTPTLNPIEILRPGTFTSEEGAAVTITAADCAAMVAAYQPTALAPIVLGHPKSDAPAQGWISEMRVRADGVVEAVPGQVDPAFAEMVAAGRYKKVSVRLYGKASPHNPTPGTLALRHVGALGAHPPAVKGLKNMTVSFAEGDADNAALSISGGLMIEHDLSFTETTKEKEAVVPIQDDKDAKDRAKADIALAEAQAELAAGQAALKQKQDIYAAQQAEGEKARIAAAHAANVSFVETAIAQAKIASPAKDQITFLLNHLSTAPTDISFGEGDKAQSPADVLRALITSASPMVSFGEFAGGSSKPGAMTSQSLTAAAQKYQAEQKAIGNIISIGEAVRHCERMGK